MKDKKKHRQNIVEITLHGNHNITYKGTLLLSQNRSALGEDIQKIGNGTSQNETSYDEIGASYYVIAVVLVYGMSIVMLIASGIKRRQEKVTEDKQINKYLQDFQIVKERHARDSYKNLKKTIMTKINWERHRKPTHHNLQQSIMPLLAITVPSVEPISEYDARSLYSSLSNVDIAAAEQYMIAKDKGKVYPTRKSGDTLTAAYFAGVHKFSVDQSPQVLAKMYKERKMSRDHSPLPQFLTRCNSQEFFYPTRPSRSRTNSGDNVLVEQPEPSPTIQSVRDTLTNDPVAEKIKPNKLIFQGSVEDRYTKALDDNFISLLSPSEDPYAKGFAQCHSHHKTGLDKLQESPVTYGMQVTPDPIGPMKSRSSSPAISGKLFPGQYGGGSSHSSSTSPRGSPALSSSPRTPSSTGSREELIHITCL